MLARHGIGIWRCLTRSRLKGFSLGRRSLAGVVRGRGLVNQPSSGRRPTDRFASIGRMSKQGRIFAGVCIRGRDSEMGVAGTKTRSCRPRRMAYDRGGIVLGWLWRRWTLWEIAGKWWLALSMVYACL